MITFLLAAVLTLLSVPDGGCVMVNGLIGEGEYGNSLAVDLDQDTRLHVHKDPDSLYMAIEFLGPRHTRIDLFGGAGWTKTMLLDFQNERVLVYLLCSASVRTSRCHAWST